MKRLYSLRTKSVLRNLKKFIADHQTWVLVKIKDLVDAELFNRLKRDTVVVDKKRRKA